MSLIVNALGSVRIIDPEGSGPIVIAVEWLQGTILGMVATVVAFVAAA
jgi:type IV secretion system protein VirB2